LGERPCLDGSELVVTVIDPPVFGPDGVASAGSLPGEGRPGWRAHHGSTP
jgi:hypothetical protein